MQFFSPKKTFKDFFHQFHCRENNYLHSIYRRIFCNLFPLHELLKIFWESHDPTTLNKQGADVGTQYRSVIFYTNDTEKEIAEEYKEKLDKSGIFKDSIVTEITKLDTFYIAEDDHQEYYENNPNQPYCLFVIKPKLDKFFKKYKNEIR